MRSLKSWVVGLLLGSFAASAAAEGPISSGDARPRLAVLDLAPAGVSPSLAAAVTGVLGNELDRLGAFRVMTSDAIRAMLALEHQKQMLGCSADAACLAEIGGALGVEYLVSGRVASLKDAHAGATFTLDLTLSAVRKAQREGSAIEVTRSEAELVGAVPRAVAKLTGKLLETRGGKLVLAVSELGALVKVDEMVRGTSPLDGALTLGGGLRSVTVEKEGFVTWQKEIPIPSGRLVEERANLVPSPDFIRQYEGRNKKLRLLAWVASGAAVAGIAGAVAFQARASHAYGDVASPDTFVYCQQKLLAGVTRGDGIDYRARASDLKSQVDTSQTLSYVAGGVGAASLAAAVVLWIVGEDPGRYSRYHESTGASMPVPSGAHASLSWEF